MRYRLRTWWELLVCWLRFHSVGVHEDENSFCGWCLYCKHQRRIISKCEECRDEIRRRQAEEGGWS